MLIASSGLSTATDAVSALQWMSRVSESDAPVFIEQADALLRNLRELPVQPLPHLAVLEVIRPRLIEALRAQLAEIDFRAVPMTQAEAASFMSAITVARQLRDAYARLAENAPTEAQVAIDPQGKEWSRDISVIFGTQVRPVSAKAIVAQRVLATQSQIIAWRYRSRTTVSPSDWEMLMRFARFARFNEIADAPVTDATLAEYRASARACVAAAVLLMLAKPQNMSVSEFNMARDLARQHAVRVKYKIEEGEAAAKISPWPSFSVTPSATLRLDTRLLTDELKRLSAELDAGYSPESLGLEKRLSPQTARESVNKLLAAWRTPVQPGPPWRTPVSDKALVVPSWHTIAAGLVKGEFDPSSTSTRSVYEYRRRNEDHVIAGEDPVTIKMQNLFASAERWTLDGENAYGFLCTRLVAAPRLNLDQLVILLANTGVQKTATFLGRIDSLEQEAQTDFSKPPKQEISVRLLLGTPTLVGIKLEAGIFEEAFLLRPQAASATATQPDPRLTSSVTSLILPLARWREGAITEMLVDGMTQRIQIGPLQFRGQDFDQVGFTSAL